MGIVEGDEAKAEDGVIVGHIQKNAQEQVRCRLSRFHGVDLCDLRIWYDAGSEYRPTSRGVAVRVERIRDLIALLEKAATEAGIEAEADEFDEAAA